MVYLIENSLLLEIFCFLSNVILPQLMRKVKSTCKLKTKSYSQNCFILLYRSICQKQKSMSTLFRKERVLGKKSSEERELISLKW